MSKEAVKQRLLQLLDIASVRGMPSQANIILDTSGLTKEAQHALLFELTQEAGVLAIKAKVLHRWADQASLEKRRPSS